MAAAQVTETIGKTFLLLEIHMFVQQFRIDDYF